MTTIAELPVASSVGSSDLLPLSQNGLLYSVTVAQLIAPMQPLLAVPTGDLLGRQSTGAGAPESISLGAGLALNEGILGATGGDHAGFPVQTTLSLSDDVVISAAGAPALLNVAAFRGLFTAGTNVSISSGGVIATTASSIAGPGGPQGAAGPAGPAGPIGNDGPAGPGLVAPAAGNSTSAIGASDYVAIWQNGASAWMPYGQFLGGQTIDQLPAAGPAADSDELLVAQGSSSLSVQSFGGVWNYLEAKLPSFKPGVVELTANTVLDGTQHNGRILIASATLTLTANFSNMGPGFSCTLINLAAGSVTMGTGITSGSGSATLPPGAAATLLGLAYSGGSLVWWSGVTPNAAAITVGTISAPAPSTAFTVSGGIFNDAPTALDYSTNGGTSWTAASTPAITANAYSFTLPGLASGTYTVKVRDHANVAVLGGSNSFTIAAPTISLNSLPSAVTVNAAFAVSGTVAPGNAAVRAGISASATTAPASWQNAAVSSGSWSTSITPASAGTIYVWAQQTAATTVQAISPAIAVVASSLSISAAASGTANSALGVSGNVVPTADAVNVQLTTSNTTAPTSGWTAASNAAGAFTASLTPAAAGTYYAWAQDPTTGLTAASAAITVAAAPTITLGFNNPGGSYPHGSGTIGLNGSVTPAQAANVQVVLSTSNTVAPSSGWQAASVIYSNALWAIYYATPATAGAYYVWVETTAGGSLAVSSFTVTVS